ncbi:MAG: O-antigen ligase family protein [Tissierella sp.]|uniref:O-antigen ligase family protein n=1 Tax=Tissierella sp. TaxID=41274 RepID=UPI003F9E5AED
MNKLKKDYPIYLMLFIILQPILDWLTYISMEYAELPVTPGVVVRMLVLVLSVFYLLTRRKIYLSKGQFLYLIIMAMFTFFHFITNYILKETFYLISELTALSKSLYFIIMFYVFMVAFKELKKRNKVNLFPKNIAIAVFLINIVMVLATVTGTGKRSYGALYKIGHSGWFYAANDIGVTLALALPIIMWFTYIKKGKKWILFNWINTILTLFSLFTIGTKVGHLAVIIVLGLTVIILAIKSFSKKNINQFNKGHLSIAALLLLLTVVLTPYLPAYTNSAGQIAALREQNEVNKDTSETNGEGDFDQDISEEDYFGESSTSESEVVNGVIYSGRSGFLDLHQDYFDEAPVIQKTFGMGYAGNFEQSPKVIERDFHDLFFQFGFLGFVLYFSPFVYYGFKVLISFWKRIGDILEMKNVMLLSSVALGLGIGFLAGHTLTSPAVSIYLTIVLAFLVEDRIHYKGELK